MPVQCPSKIKQHKSLDAVYVVLTTRVACRPSLVSCLSSLGESLLSVTVADGQSLGVPSSLSAASESGSHETAVVPGSVYSATIVEPGVPEVGTLVHILTRGGFEAHDVLSSLTLPIEPKPRGQHRPFPPRSILSPRGSFYLP
uniref:Uncharacterized protein n=1 Tax=Tanacetum cinerariifolium TaxID=118510 RepID=A0A699IAT8_TANCI|nr:hypothetical protein [Tanacetum cinerariifolium]